jgi:hypothetical protein
MTQVAISGRNASLNAVNALINAGSVEIRTGAAAAVDSTPTGTVLATFTMGATAFNAASAGSSSAILPADTTASTAGTAGHYVVKDSGGNVERNGTAGTAGADMILNAVVFAVSDAVSITSWTFSQPGS